MDSLHLIAIYGVPHVRIDALVYVLRERGKSSLVNELQKALLPRGWFASGKFDQYQRDVPYAPLAQAFQRLVGIILADVEAELARWRDTTVTAVDPSERVINLMSRSRARNRPATAADGARAKGCPTVLEQVVGRFAAVFARAVDKR